MTIHWFPGHMAKALKNMRDKIKLVDIIIEVVDARIPMCSRNPELSSILEDKKRILVINKADLVLTKDLEKWLTWFKNKGETVIPINSKDGHGINFLIKEIKVLGFDIIKKAFQKGIRVRPIRIMVVGIPNVGKSSLINRITGRTGAVVQNKPGVTRGYQWIKVRGDIELLDTPGVLWPKIQDEDCGYKLAITGAIKDDLFLKEDVAKKLIYYLMNINPNSFMERYQIDITNKSIDSILCEIANKRGCRISENNLDLSRASEILINDYRNGKLGKIILELPLE